MVVVVLCNFQESTWSNRLMLWLPLKGMPGKGPGSWEMAALPEQWPNIWALIGEQHSCCERNISHAWEKGLEGICSVNPSEAQRCCLPCPADGKLRQRLIFTHCWGSPWWNRHWSLCLKLMPSALMKKSHFNWIEIRKHQDGFQLTNGSKIRKEKVKPGLWVDRHLHMSLSVKVSSAPSMDVNSLLWTAPKMPAGSSRLQEAHEWSLMKSQAQHPRSDSCSSLK